MAKVAFLGLGVMGFPMAGHLVVKGGHDVTVYNRSPAKAQAWAEKFKGKTAPTPQAAAEGQDFVMTCVGNDNDLRAVTLAANGAFAGIKAGAVFVDHTTASAEVARELDAEATKRGFKFIDAPYRRPGGRGKRRADRDVRRQRGRLCEGRAGDRRLRQDVQVAGPRGLRPVDQDGQPDCIAGLVEGLSEGIHFAKKAGLDVHAVIDTISKGAAQSWQMENRYKTMNDGKFDFGFAVEWMRKDLSICLAEVAAQRRQPSGHRALRCILCGGGENGRQALGYVEPARPAGALTYVPCGN